MVAPGKTDNEIGRTNRSQVGGPDLTVVSIHRHATAERDSEFDQDRCHGPSERTESGVALADIVKCAGPDRQSVSRVDRGDGCPGIETVTLIATVLREKDFDLGRGQPRGDRRDLGVG